MKKVQIVFAVMLITASFPIYAQNKLVDSLKNALAISTDENRYHILWRLAYELFDVDNKEALRFAKEAYPLALKAGDSLKIVKSTRLLGQLLRKSNRIDESIKLLTQVLPVSTRNKFDIESQLVLNALALAHGYRGEFSRAIDYHFQSLTICEKQGDIKGMSISYNNIGLAYYKLGSFELALDYYFRSLKAKQESSSTFDLGILLVNIGLTYIELRDYENATRYINQGFETCSSDCGPTVIINGEHGIGLICFYRNQFSSASAHFEESLKLSERENNQELQIDNLMRLASIAINSSDFRKAESYLKRIQQISEKDQFRQSMVEVYKLSAIVAKHAGDVEKAYLYQSKHSELLDSVFAFESNKTIMRAQIEYQEKENQARLESQERIMALQNESLRSHQTLNLMIGIAAALSLGMTAILFRSNRHKRMVNQLLDLRVRERTAELEESRDLLQHSHDRQEIVLGRVVSELNSAFGTIRGLAAIATSDLPEEKVRYFRELEVTVGQLASNVKNVIHERPNA